MLNNDFILLSNVILFNRKDIKYTILNSDNDIVDLINTLCCPVEYENKVIGYLTHPYLENGMVCGDVCIQKEYKDIISKIPMIQYEYISQIDSVYGDKINITNIIVHCKNH